MKSWLEKNYTIMDSTNNIYVNKTYVINDINDQEIIGTFYKKELQKTNQEEFRIKKVTKKKVINYMLNGRDMIIHLIVGLIKRT